MFKPFSIYRSQDSKFYVTMTARNGEKLNTSETLGSKQSALNNIKSCISVVTGKKIISNTEAWGITNDLTK